MKISKSLLAAFCLIFLLTLSASAQPTQVNGQSMGHRLLIYYGIPLGVNATWDTNKAAAVFAKYDVIVFGEGLEEKKHTFHVSTKEIIPLIREGNPNVKIYGYVDLDVKKINYPNEVLFDKTDKWKSMGADGIFLDDAGYDFLVSRERLNTIIKYIHDQELSAFVNAWKPDDVMGNAVDEKFNPKGEKTLMDERDIYLLEDLLEPTDISDPNSKSAFSPNFRQKMDKSLTYRQTLDVKLMAISDIDFDQYSENAVRKFFRMTEAASSIFSLDAYGVAPKEYSSSKSGRDIARSFPYISNYMNYYTKDVSYKAKYDNRDFARGGFRLHSLPGEHYYNYPSDAK